MIQISVIVADLYNSYPAKIKNLPLGEETPRQEIGDRSRKKTIDHYPIYKTYNYVKFV
jgi:hypothetical protein